jgi:myo-inositol-1(or 4)-monophosphatase
MARPPEPTHLDEELRVASELARRAGEAVLRHGRSGIERRTKAGDELVTAADVEVDAILRAGLAGAFPDDAVLSEEATDSRRRLTTRRVWILDPIDGTEDFAAGGDQHAISVALTVDGRPVLGVVLNPARGELFAGVVGRGLRLGDAPARASAASAPETARLTVSGTEWDAGVYREVRTLPLRPLSSSAYKLARVAAGLDDGTLWVWPRREWDVCAGVALVLAAGGHATLLDGSEIPFNRPDPRLGGGLVAAGASLHAPLRSELVRLGLAQR